jgi:hypothetical protein
MVPYRCCFRQAPVVYTQDPHLPLLGMARGRLHPPEYRISAGDHSHLLQQTRSRQSAQNITDSPQRLGQSIRFSCLRGGDARKSLRKDLAWTVPIATAKATSLHPDLHRLSLPGQITQTANIGAVIRNFRSRTARALRPSPTSNPENNIPFDLLHGVQYQQPWLGQRTLHNINGLAHKPQHSKLVKPAPKVRKNPFKYSSTAIKRVDVDTGAVPLRVVGVDDWAWKMGQTCGTILVDLERRGGRHPSRREHAKLWGAQAATATWDRSAIGRNPWCHCRKAFSKVPFST